MEYHYVVCWSEEKGWSIDWDATMARFSEGSVYINNLDEWVTPVGDSETGDTEIIIADQLAQIFETLNHKL